MGLSIRCAGHGNHVLIVQFLKSRPTGELASLALLPNIEVMRGKETKKFTFQMNDEEKAEVKREHMVLFDKVKQKCANEHIDLLIFDEIIGACNRNPAPELVELADYVSEVCMRKHPFKRGIPARVGIEK